jgi:hypothetical protein
MKSLSLVFAALALTAITSTTPVGANPSLIVPGHSMGRTALGPHGDSYLKRLPKPNASDAGMSQLRLVWVSKPMTGKPHTLFIHTVSNGALNIKPYSDVTIDQIRVTSPYFHTQSGIHTGSTLAAIRKQFPHLHNVQEKGVYESKGIAFEFDSPVNSQSRCVAIAVIDEHAPQASIATTSNIQNLLSEGRP